MDIFKQPIFWVVVGVLLIVIIVLAVLYGTTKAQVQTQVPHMPIVEKPSEYKMPEKVPVVQEVPLAPAPSQPSVSQVPTSTPLQVSQPTPPPVTPDLTGMIQPPVVYQPQVPVPQVPIPQVPIPQVPIPQVPVPQQPTRRPLIPQQPVQPKQPTQMPTGQPSTQPSQPAGFGPVPTDQNVWIAEHNRVRADVGQDPVTWDDTIAASAQAYVNKCVWAHDPNNKTYGENLAIMGPFSSGTEKKQFVMWEDEKKLYTYPQTPNQNTAAGHLTQLLNKNVKKIGCACAKCSGDLAGGQVPDTKYCICRYDFFQLGNEPPY